MPDEPDEWNDAFEPDGITLGPEHRLEREITKSKALKVERLQLKDRISQLEANNTNLQNENTRLKNELAVRGDLNPPPPGVLPDSPESPGKTEQNACWVKGAVVLLFLTFGLLYLRWFMG